MKKEGRNTLLDEIKAVACIFVVLIHCKFPWIVGDAFEAVARFGVPLFFTISGLYLIRSNSESPSGIRISTKNKIIRTFSVTLKLWIFYTVYSFIYAQSVGFGMGKWFAEKFNLFEFSRLILFNSGKFIYDFTYAFDHLWYLLALIYVYLLVYIFAGMVRRYCEILAACLMFLLFVLELLQTYYPIRPFGISISTWYTVRNWLFVGMPFMMLGVWMNKREMNGKILPVYTGWSLIFAGIVLTFAEFSIWGSKEVYLGSLLIVIGCIALSQNNKKNRTDNLFSFIGHELSSYVYYMHVFVISLIGWIIDHFCDTLYGNAVFMYIRPVIVTLITIILSFCMYKVKNIMYNMQRKSG